MNTAVLVSGGVDSSVALALLKEQGVDLTAFYLKIWLEDELSFLGDCPWEEDVACVKSVCEHLEIKFEIIPLQREYWQQVVSHTIAEIKAGRTPNPDILCNQRVKFGAFFDVIGSRFDKVATGHYAQVHEQDGVFHLLRSPDEIKDQTYFLALLSQQQLSRALFPIGGYLKSEVRSIAERFNLPNKARKDSQGICFLGKISFPDFIKYHLGEKVGKLIEYETGAVMGEHHGYWFYTIGQRQGIGLAGGPWYVVAKDIDANVVFISRAYYSSEKERNRCVIGGCNWILGQIPLDKEVLVKLRHGPRLHKAFIARCGDDAYEITLADRDQGIAVGQYAVVYDGEECLGGGMIQATRSCVHSQ